MAASSSSPPQRQRANSTTLDEYLMAGHGQIPSMEASGNEMKGETIIVGACRHTRGTRQRQRIGWPRSRSRRWRSG